MLELIVISTLNGVLFGMLLFLLSSGLTVIFSMMGVLNFAHASFYMLGAFFGYQLTRWIGFWPALVLAPLLVGAVGMAVERYGLRNTHKHGHVAELLLTFGLAFAIEEIVSMIWGKSPVDYRVPAALDFPAFTIFSTNYPAYKIFMLAVSVVDLRRAADRPQEDPGRPDRAGGADPSEHGRPSRPQCRARVHAGVRRRHARSPGVAGVIAGPALVTQSDMAGLLGPILFVVVVVGGLGSLPGAFIASLLIGLVQTFAVALNGSLASAFGPLDPEPRSVACSPTSGMSPSPRSRRSCPIVLLVLILIVRPMGLLGTRET